MMRSSEGATSRRAEIQSAPASAIRIASIASTGAINIGTGIATTASKRDDRGDPHQQLRRKDRHLASMRDGDGAHHLVNRVVGAHPLDLGARFQHHAMAQRRADDRLHVFGQNEVAPFQRRDRFRAAHHP